MQFHERLKQLREKKGWTQNDVASILDIAKSTYVKYERGEREPRYGTLIALAELFQVSADYLLGKSEVDSINKERISEAYNYIFSDEFTKNHGEYLDTINKFISKFFRLLYLPNSAEVLDILYITTQIENILIDLHDVGNHICCYDKWAAEDNEYKATVNPPTQDDFRQFVHKSLQARKLLDDYINTISTEEYYESPFLIFTEEIDFESKMDLLNLKMKFRNIPGYKTE